MSLKTVNVDEETWQTLHIIKRQLGYESLAEVIAFLVKGQEARVLKAVEQRKAA